MARSAARVSRLRRWCVSPLEGRSSWSPLGGRMPRGSAPLCRQMGTVVLLALASGCDLDPTHPQARITTASPLPDAVVGVYYDQAVSSLRADGTAGNPSWSLRADSGPVPDGLSFCAGTDPPGCRAGSIHGTP